MSVGLQAPSGEKLTLEALVDGGAMVAALDEKLFERVKDRFPGWEPSVKRLRMANGVVVSAKAQWRGRVILQGEEVEGVLQVFDSGGGWDMLFGKPLLQAFGAVHDFGDDSVRVRKKAVEVFQEGLGKEVAVKSIPEDETAAVQHMSEDKAYTSDGASAKAQTPRFRDVKHSVLKLNKLTPINGSFSDLPFDGESLGFETHGEMLA
ncbi:hypothetical protein F5879DRAFT_813669 [Lentinula edodes]|nr:hypothetical protein F5879DRAFT_813669 [Lentinula edodes]